MKKVVMFMLAAVLILSTVHVVTQKVDAATATAVKVIPKTLTDDVSYVQVVFNNKAVEKKINTRIYKFAQQQQAYIDGAFKKQITEAKKDKVDTTNWSYTANFETKPAYNKNNKLSLTFSAYEFTGGAHGLPIQSTFNFDLKTGNEIKLSQLISKKGLPAVNKHVKAAMTAANKGKDGPIFWVEEFKTIDTARHQFYFTDKGITIYFEPYEVAPYAAGFPWVNVPQSLLK